MRGAVIYGAGDVRLEKLPDPEIIEPTDAIVRNAATCICGSDLWDYRGINPVPEPKPFGHEYCGILEEAGDNVTSVKPGDFVIGSSFASDGTCPNCRNGFQSSCLHAVLMGGCQAEAVRIPMVDGSLVTSLSNPIRNWFPVC